MRRSAANDRCAYLVDASIYIFRAWFSLPDTLTDTDGAPVNAAYGYLRFLVELVEEVAPRHIAVAFDESLTTSFRNELFPAYKANRELPPPELERQFDLCRRLTRDAGIRCLVDSRFEADDLIASAAVTLRRFGVPCVVVSADKDLAQVIEEGDLWWDHARNRKLDGAGVEERFGIRPGQISDYLALVGDAVDNIPGVPGIGPKSAARLLRLYPDLETLYDKLDQVTHLAMRGAARIASQLRAHQEQVFLSRRLATLAVDIPVGESPEDFVVARADIGALRTLVGRMDRGGGFVERIRAALGN